MDKKFKQQDKGLDGRGTESALSGVEATPGGTELRPVIGPSPSTGAPETVYYHYDLSEREAEKFFSKHFSSGTEYRSVYSDRAPDIICIFGIPGEFLKFRTWRLILQARRRFGWKPVVFSFSYEPGPADKSVDFSFHYQPTDEKNQQQFLLGLVKPLLSPERNELLQQRRRVEKTRFCSFIYSSSHGQSHVRRGFCQLLAQYKSVDCPGASLNNTPKIENSMPGKLDFMASCKFNISFESVSSPSYLSEKLIDAFLAGAVPIYWGNPEASRYFNPAAFVNCHDYRSFEEVVEKVAEIDASPSLYEEYRNAPPILPESCIHQIKHAKSKRHFAAIVNEALARRRRKRNRLLETFRLGFILCSHLYLEITHMRLFQKFYKLWRRFHSARKQSLQSGDVLRSSIRSRP